MFNKILAANARANVWYDRIPEPQRMIMFIGSMVAIFFISLIWLGSPGNMMMNLPVVLALGASRMAYFKFKIAPNLIRSGRFAGMKIEMGSDSRLKIHGELIPEFMHTILDIDAFLITDESDLYDFCSLDASVDEMWAKITSVYGITREEVKSDYIVDILDSIRSRGKPH